MLTQSTGEGEAVEEVGQGLGVFGGVDFDGVRLAWGEREGDGGERAFEGFGFNLGDLVVEERGLGFGGEDAQAIFVNLDQSPGALEAHDQEWHEADQAQGGAEGEEERALASGAVFACEDAVEGQGLRGEKHEDGGDVVGDGRLAAGVEELAEGGVGRGHWGEFNREVMGKGKKLIGGRGEH